MEDWDLLNTPDTTHHPTTMEHTENWDDDCEVEKWNNLPRKLKVSMLQRWDVREESWDDELELKLKLKCDGLDPEFVRRDENKDYMTALLHHAALSQFPSTNPSPPPPILFFPSNNQHPSPEPFPFPCSPMVSVSSVPNTTHTYSSLTPLVYSS